ncbi:flagellar motor switch protein FliN [uncultured Flavonifractor sp.]|uniref:flagellar motor switch protein FliN n=1 Tax=uncultured Flavonifractor sp. TaxID=1193534 RepID=UPI002627D3BB|nr:flagellar motor switch protein FliN [uncultured Flavonifractor sp.]
MSQNIFNSMELDAIGELMNISLGSSATAVSNMLDHRVDITTPTVGVVTVEDFSLGDLEPAIGIEIKYVSGLEGSNIMLLKRNDVKVIVDILMGSETPDEEFELNELTVSAVCEVMNQMMGAASTALSDFLGYPVNISTPQSFALDDLDTFKKEHFPPSDGNLVVVRFMLGIENILQSEFVNVMSVDLARDLLAGFEMNFGSPAGAAAAAPEPAPAPAPQPAAAAPAASGGGAPLSQEEIERMMGGGGATAPTSEPAAAQQPMMQQPMMQQPTVQQPMMQQPMMQQPMMQQEPRLITARQAQLPALDVEDRLGKEQADNLEMIMSVPLEVSVEIGRTRRKVEDILSFTKGSLVVLDKLAGDQVDLFVNGLCVARGDVVVIDDNFGVRITEVLKHGELFQMS